MFRQRLVIRYRDPIVFVNDVRKGQKECRCSEEDQVQSAVDHDCHPR